MDRSREELQDKMINDLALNYAICLVKYGVDIREKWETAIQNKMVLDQAYLRGRADERKSIEEVLDKKLLLKLPCNVEDTVYSVEFRDRGKIVEEKVISFQITKDHIWVYGECDKFIGKLGGSVFATKEEAEAKLREIS